MRTNKRIDMPAIGSSTLEQLRVLLAVADTGSFSAAARQINRRQSVVSYTIAQLEDQLGGLKLFDRNRRRPVLTEAGKVMLAEARKLSAGVDGIRARARGLLDGLEAELTVAVDVMMPSRWLTCALVAFRSAFPTVTLRLYVETLGSVSKLVLDGTCTVGVSGPAAMAVEGIERRSIGSLTLVHVACPDHPLAKLRRPVTEADVRGHVQLVLTDRSDLTQGQDFGVISPETWRLADLGAKHALLLAGLGWGGMPAEAVAEDLREGRLVALKMQSLPRVQFPLFAVHRADRPPGPAARWLMERLEERIAGIGEPEPDLSRAALRWSAA